MPEEIELNDTVVESITGFTGVVVGITEWNTGCKRMVVQGTKLKEDGTPTDPCSFDEVTLKIKKKATEKKEPSVKGGPRPTPSRHPAIH